MARQKPRHERAHLHQFEPGQFGECFANLAERARGQTRDGKPFYACKFRDKARAVSAMIWADADLFADCDANWVAGEYYKLQFLYQEHEKYGPQIEIHAIRPVTDDDAADGFDLGDFVDASRFRPSDMLRDLRTLVETEVADDTLREVVQALLLEYEERLLILPGSQRHYYPFVGGWLEHTLSVARNCVWLADRYLASNAGAGRWLNRDIVVAGAVLHDIGRAEELEAKPLPGQTVRGQLVGHVALGRDIVVRKMGQFDSLDPRLALMLEHVMQSYLTLPEWGSPRLPQIPEVLIIHHADDLDAKLEMYLRCLSRDQSAGDFTERDPALGRMLYRDRPPPRPAGNPPGDAP